jgi:ATP-dependent protease HslVU (ClpYQ) peptidase subunit
MTCIIGYEIDGKVYMGGDSAATGSTTQRISKSDKVFHRGNFLIGYTSSFRMGQVLRFQLTVPAQKKDQEDYEYMCTTFVDAVIKLFKKSSFIKEDANEGGTFLVGYNGKLYIVDHDFQVNFSEDPFESCGSGSEIAMGAMKILHDVETKLKPKQKIIRALEAASRYDAAVRPPFIVLEL